MGKAEIIQRPQINVLNLTRSCRTLKWKEWTEITTTKLLLKWSNLALNYVVGNLKIGWWFGSALQSRTCISKLTVLTAECHLWTLEAMHACFITEQNPGKDRLFFIINHYFLKLEGIPHAPPRFFLNSGFRQKQSVHYVEFKKAHATGLSSYPQANNLANPWHQTFKSKFISCFLQPTVY